MSVKKYVPVMVTPFQADQTIAYKSLDELIELYLNAGAGGLFANCLSSEMFHLSKAEMLQMVRFIVEKVNGRVPVVATGTFAEPVEDQALFVKQMYETGVASVIVITSLLADEADDDATFRANACKLVALTGDVPLGFYECPVPYKRLIAADFLGELVATGRVNYHKDTCLDIGEVREKLAATRAHADFGLYDAYMVHAVESLRAGSAGLSCIQGNYFPELVVWLCDHYQEDTAELAEVQRFFARHMNVMHDTYPASAKYILEKRGLDIGLTCRNGSTVGGGGDLEKLDRLLEEYGALSERIGLASIIEK